MNDHQPSRIGVVAATHERARSVAKELGLTSYVAVGADQIHNAVRGLTLRAVIIDHTASKADLDAIKPCLFASRGQAYTLQRVAW